MQQPSRDLWQKLPGYTSDEVPEPPLDLRATGTHHFLPVPIPHAKEEDTSSERSGRSEPTASQLEGRLTEATIRTWTDMDGADIRLFLMGVLQCVSYVGCCVLCLLPNWTCGWRPRTLGAEPKNEGMFDEPHKVHARARSPPPPRSEQGLENHVLQNYAMT